MNIAEFQQTGGLPVETDTFTFLQNSYNIFNDLGNVIGDKSIIKGCVLTGNTVSNGSIYVNGELLEFRGGLQQSQIVIREVVEALTEFKVGPAKEVYKTRYAEFGTGIGAINWSEFKRAYPLTSALVIDEIKMYVGDLDNLPWGWYLCDGQNGTMDLRRQFIAGFDADNEEYNEIGKEGGSDIVALTIDEMPEHKHTGTTYSAGSHTHTTPNSNSDGGSGKPATGSQPPEGTGYHTTNAAGAHTHNLNINNRGHGQAHENRPQFKAIPFIQFKGV